MRFFAPWAGIDEDPVTGASNTPTSAVIKQLKIDDSLPSAAQALCMCTSYIVESTAHTMMMARPWSLLKP